MAYPPLNDIASIVSVLLLAWYSSATMYERDTFRRLREAVESRSLNPHFWTEDVNKELQDT
jgi:hypothetical protein